MNEKEVSAPVVTHLEAMTSIDSTDPKVRDVTNLDAAARFIVEHGETATEITAEESAAVRRKIDKRLMPLMAIMYLNQQLDKSAISFSSVFNFQKDTGLHGTQFAWLSTIVYIGALIGQPLAVYALARLPVGYYVSANYVAWSICMLCMTACTSFPGLAALRFLLGLFEASIAPTMMIVTAMWWTRREQGFRSQWWYLQNGFSSIFGSLLTYGLGHIDNSVLKPYQRIFLAIGLISFCCSIPNALLFPNSPVTAKFLNENEKRIALERVRYNQTGVQGQHFKWEHVREVALDPKTYLLIGIILPKAITAGGLGTFGPLVLQGLGYNQFQTTLFNMIPGAIQIVFGFFAGWWMTKYKYKSPMLMLLVVISLAGSIGMYISPRGEQYRPQLLAFYMLLQFSGSAAPLVFAWANTNTAGSTKKATIASVEWTFVCIGNAIGPQLFAHDVGPYYFIALRSQVISLSVIILCVVAMATWLHMLNKRNARRRAARGASENLVDLSLEAESKWAELREKQLEFNTTAGTTTQIGEQAFLDLTDLENDTFIYSF